jgi:hypothetical protein
MLHPTFFVTLLGFSLSYSLSFMRQAMNGISLLFLEDLLAFWIGQPTA